MTDFTHYEPGATYSGHMNDLLMALTKAMDAGTFIESFDFTGPQHKISIQWTRETNL